MWDQRYASDTYSYGTEPNDFLRYHVDRLPVGNTLCIGEGEGRNAVFLASHGHNVTALDGSKVGLAKAEALAEQKGVHIKTIHADLANYTFETGAWDTIVSIFCHVPQELRKQVHRQIPQALRSGGAFILEAYTPDQLQYGTGGPPAVDMMMDLLSLKQEVTGLEFVHGTELVREIKEGEFHNGKGAVVQTIAVKA